MQEELNQSLNKIVESLTKLEQSTKSISIFTNEIAKLDQSLLQLSTTSSNIDSNNIMSYFQTFNTVMNSVNNVSKLNDALKNLGNEIIGLANIFGMSNAVTQAATTVTGVFSSALAFLASNPMIAVIGSIGLVVGALAIFGDHESEAEKQTRLFAEAQEQKRKELQETSKAINESTSASINHAKEAEIQSDVLKGFVENLKGLADENGYVKNFEEAQYYVDQINSAMPRTVELTKDGKLNWLENSEAIEKNIQQLERKAKVEAYYDEYVESLKNESKLRSELTLAQSHYNAELEKKNEYERGFQELLDKSKEERLTLEEVERLEDYQQKLEESSNKLSEYSDTLDSARGAYDANAKSAELYQQAVGALDSSVQSSAQLQANEYLELEENGTSTWNSLAAASEDCKNRMGTAQGDELETIKVTSALIQTEMISKANQMGLSYDEMVKKLEESGAQMNEDEKNQLKKSYDQWKMSGEDIRSLESKGLDTLKLMKMTALTSMNDNDKTKLAENVKLFSENGSKSGLELCQKLADNIEANNGKVTDETNQILNEIEEEAKKCNPNTKVNVNAPTDKNMKNVKKIIDGIPKEKDTLCKVTAKADKKSFSIFGITLPFFASGGFPDTGELFVAREAGPELVGRINGKTAVANNDQIISGISSGVFNAVTSAIKGINGKSNMNIHATFVMDGEIVGKQVINYHNGIVRRTGHSPLMI